MTPNPSHPLLPSPAVTPDGVPSGTSVLDANIILIAAVTERVRDIMTQNDASHDFLHIQRVLALARKLLVEESKLNPTQHYDELVVILGALAHDVGDHKYCRPGEDISTMIHNLLAELGAAEALCQKVQRIGTNVSYKREKQEPAITRAVIEEIPELAIVQDADRLDALGAVGIGRTFTYGGVMKRTHMQETIDHFDDKLFELGDMMKTKAGKKLAKKRTDRLRCFRDWWTEETGVVDELPELFKHQK